MIYVVIARLGTNIDPDEFVTIWAGTNYDKARVIADIYKDEESNISEYAESELEEGIYL